MNLVPVYASSPRKRGRSGVRRKTLGSRFRGNDDFEDASVTQFRNAKQTSIHADVNPYRRQSDASGDSGRWLRRDIGAVEIVMRRRVHLVALDFLAHGLEANRVSHRDPR